MRGDGQVCPKYDEGEELPEVLSHVCIWQGVVKAILSDEDRM
jgi:hypothetical protein